MNSSLEISQYAHAAWTIRASELNGYPTSFAQTTDGYLWIGTESGLLRFDGVRFVQWQPPGEAHKLSGTVVKLLAGRDGSLWIATQSGLGRWKDNTLTQYAGFAGQYLEALVEDRDGTIWVGTSGGLTGFGTLCAIDRRGVQCHGQDGSFGRFVLSLYEDRRGQLWVGAATGLWRWKPDRPERYPLGSGLSEVHSVIEAADGTLLVAVNRGLKQLVSGHLEDYPLQHVGPTLKPTSLLRDRDGAVWMGTQDQGLWHVHGGRTDRFSRADGLSGNFVPDLFEDREGNVWVATLNGLDRFHDFAVARISSKQGLSTDSVVSLLAPNEGGVWVATLAGLDRWSNGRVTSHSGRLGVADDSVASLFEDRRGRLWVSSARGVVYIENGRPTPVGGVAARYVQAMAEDEAGNVWLSDQDRGLLRVAGGRAVEVIPWSTFGGKSARTLMADPSHGGLWLGFFQGGVSYFDHGRIGASYTREEGLGEGQVTSLRMDTAGALWAATAGGLSRLENHHIETLSTREGLPCEVVYWSIEDDTGGLWLHTVCGLVHIARRDVHAWISDPRRRVPMTTYDDTDGVARHADIGSYSPKVTRSADGLLWFVTPEGVGQLDPEHIPFNRIAPPVHIEQATADRHTYEIVPRLRLPPLVRDMRIDYTATSLVVPERVRFRYKLEGHDADWTDAGNRRQAFYTDLSPRTYRFRVLAANNDGVWNEDGATWEFSIAPAYYQTSAFKLTLALAVLGLIGALYRVNLHRVAAQLNMRFEERLAERTRIARELHDTLLQGFISASMQLHIAAEEVADHPVHTRLARILRQIAQVVEEGRRTVQGLRTPIRTAEELEQALVRDAEDLRGQQDVDIRLIVQGTRRPLQPMLRDQVYRIVREGLTNAFRHAQATRIEIELEYSATHLKVNVRDNGCGMKPDILEFGREGHWGIRGMRERAEHVGGTLDVWSSPTSGTDVALTVPGEAAFERPPSTSAPRWFRPTWRPRWWR